MTDDRNNPAGPPPEPTPPPLADSAPPPLADPAPPPLAEPAPPPLADAAPPPLAAAPPPAPPVYPPAQDLASAPTYYPEAKRPPWGWIIAGILGLALIILAILYFTGALGGSRDSDGSTEETSGYPASDRPSGFGSGSGMLTAGWLVGTWSPSCSNGRAQTIIFTSDNRYFAPGDSGTWTLSGSVVTLRGAGRTLMMRWENLGVSRARVTELASGQSNYLSRCR